MLLYIFFLLWIPITASLLFAPLAVNEFTFCVILPLRFYGTPVPKPSSRQCYFGQVLLLSPFFSLSFSLSLCGALKLTRSFVEYVHMALRFSVVCYVLCCVCVIFFLSLGFFLAGVQNIVFYLIYLNTNRHVLVQLLRFPAGIQSLAQTMKRLPLFLFNFCMLYVLFLSWFFFICCRSELFYVTRFVIHIPKIVEIRCSKRV